jgi:hypothetical protein
MRFCFLHGGLLELIGADDRSFRTRRGYLIQTDVLENIRVGTGLSGSWAQHIQAAF